MGSGWRSTRTQRVYTDYSYAEIHDFFRGKPCSIRSLSTIPSLRSAGLQNTIPLAGTGVSRRHLRIEEDYDGSYFLSDLHSLNGTIVNGKQVRKIPLHAGDIIVVGTYSIIFEEVPKKDDFIAAAGAPAGKFPLTGSSSKPLW